MYNVINRVIHRNQYAQTQNRTHKKKEAIRYYFILDYAEGGGAKNGIGTPGMVGIGGSVTLGTVGIGGRVTFGTTGTAGMGGNAAAAFGMAGTTGIAGTAGVGGKVATGIAGTVGTAGIGGRVMAGTVGTVGFGTVGTPGTAAGAAAGAVSSARRRTAWLVVLPPSTSAMMSAAVNIADLEAIGDLEVGHYRKPGPSLGMCGKSDRAGPQNSGGLQGYSTS
jgi:hypothetical protein